MTRLQRFRTFPHATRIFGLLASACFLFAQPARSQQPQLDALASQCAKALDQAHLKSVVVLDFYGPGLKATQLGRDLADQFSTALSTDSSGKFQVLDRSRLENFIQKQRFSPLIRSLASVGFPGNEFGAEALIEGEFSTISGDSSLKLELHCLKTESQNQEIADFQAEFAQSTNIKSALLEVIPGTDYSVYTESGKNGVTEPTCVHCPTPPFPDQAFRAKINGSVVLGAVITPEGKADKLVVFKGMPDGLTASAIHAVKKWKFKPSMGPDGNPIAVWIVIEVYFNIH